jgi:endonuclease-3
MGGKSRSQSARPAVARRSADTVAKILGVLQEQWGHATCELNHENAYQLLVATILSAQATDKKINEVTPALFSRYPDAAALADADPDELEEMIRSTGFFRMKARHLLGMARAVVADHGGQIPQTMEAMVALPGVARKTANLVLGVAFGEPTGIVVDTHVQRVSRRLGLTAETAPEKIERDLMDQIPKERWIDVSQQIIWHGRRICESRKPACDRCPLAPLCPEARV